MSVVQTHLMDNFMRKMIALAILIAAGISFVKAAALVTDRNNGTHSKFLDLGDCFSTSTEARCCYVSNTTVLCRHQDCPSAYYVIGSVAVGLENELKKISKYLPETGSFSEDTQYTLCTRCDDACANCTGPGDDNCTYCAQGYSKEQSGLHRCVKTESTFAQFFLKQTNIIIIAACVLAISTLLGFIVIKRRRWEIYYNFYLRATKNRLRCSDISLPIDDNFNNVVEDDQPIFSYKWHFCNTFDASGGSMQGEQSDVVLTLPEGTVSCTQYVAGAICTDLDYVTRQLKLSEPVTIVSPVVEYHAGSNFRFNKPVSISLPHFLPPSWTDDSVVVFQIERDRDLREEVKVTKLKLEHRKEDHHHSSGTFVVDENRVEIFTDHFTAYFCAYCGTAVLPQPLVLDVWAKHLELENPRQREVDVRAYIWIGAKFMTKDFRMGVLDRERVNFLAMEPIDLKPLKMYAGPDSQNVRLRAQMELPERMQEAWQHAEYRGELKHPEIWDLELGDLVPCECIPACQLVEWQLTNKHDARPDDVMRCYVIVGYVTKEGGHVQEPRRVMMEVKVNKKLDPQFSGAQAGALRSSLTSSIVTTENDDNASCCSSECTEESDTTGLLKHDFCQKQHHHRKQQQQHQTCPKDVATSSSGVSSLSAEGQETSRKLRRPHNRNSKRQEERTSTTTVPRTSTSSGSSWEDACFGGDTTSSFSSALRVKNVATMNIYQLPPMESQTSFRSSEDADSNICTFSIESESSSQDGDPTVTVFSGEPQSSTRTLEGAASTLSTPSSQCLLPAGPTQAARSNSDTSFRGLQPSTRTLQDAGSGICVSSSDPLWPEPGHHRTIPLFAEEETLQAAATSSRRSQREGECMRPPVDCTDGDRVEEV